MKSFTTLALAALAVSAHAGGSPFRGRDIDGKWRAPRETQPAAVELSYMAQIDLQEDFSFATPVAEKAPETTAPASLSDRNFWGRDTRDNTCAYISGNASDSLYCAATAGCVVNTDISLVGCCADTITSCNIYTTCLPASSSSDFTTDNGLTLFCSDNTYSECVTHYYVDTIYSGYTLLGCGKTKAVDDVYYQPTTDSSTSTTSRRTTTTSSTSTRTTSSSSSTTDDTTTTAPASTSGSSSSGSSSGGSKSNTGAIVGGVVGGVGGIALIAAGIFFFMRHNKKKQSSVPPVVGGGYAGAPGGPGGPGQPPVAQNGYYNGVPGGDGGGVAGGAVAGAAAAAAGAAGAAYHYGQPGQPQDNKLYDPYMPQGQQQQQQQQQYPLQQPYDPARASMYTATSPLGSPQPAPSPQSAAFGTPQPYTGSPDTNGVSAQHTGGSPQPPLAPYSAPPPAAGMGFHSGPVAAELPTEREHGTVQEMA